ncbi:MAG: hypothetical protein INR73_21650 [Williamsia sp.]|nr:hypothetical protein [Williamsia sp.]
MPGTNVYFDPFRAWNRLEPVSRKAEFDKVLECGVHDALWMLTRQWQFGEFKGEDAGSAILAKVLMQTSTITRTKLGGGTAQKWSDGQPLEKTVEGLAWKPDLTVQLEAAFAFLQYLQTAAKGAGLADFNRKAHKEKLRELFPLAPVPPIDPADPARAIVQKAAQLSREKAVEMEQVSAARYFDGYLLYQSAAANVRDTAAKVAAVNPAHSAVIGTALRQLTAWFQQTYGDQLATANKAWNPARMEYQFACAVPQTGANNTVLSASEYYTGELDWYAFDVNKREAAEGLSGEATGEEGAAMGSRLMTVIPTQASFPGAPSARWWQFENGRVDLGNINAGKTDIAKMIFTEYAMLYNTDWFMVPYPVPAGSLCEVKGIVVTDTFGEQSFVEAAVQGETDDWSGWGMFNLSTQHADGVRNLPADTRLFIPPATVKTIESEPVEEVHFVRDELSNHVWAIETRLADGLGGSMDGYEAARAVTGKLEEWADRPDKPVEQETKLTYSLANTVPENWIPFLPVHVKDSNRAIQLQRAAMPRLFRNSYTHVRPRTDLLRTDINEANEQTHPFYIHEEEVPRAGIRVKSTHQRTRWYNGAVINWYGYRKTAGKGEGSSGLEFDCLNLDSQD